MPKVDLYVDGYEEALETLTAEAERHPEYADIQHRLGLLYYLSGDPERACEYHQGALAINPHYLAARSALGYAHEAAGDRDAALCVWQQADQRQGGADHPGLGFDLAMAAGRRGAPRQGLEELDRFTPESCFRDLVARERMLLLLLAGEVESGTQALLELRARSPHFRAYFRQTGLLHEGEFRPEALGRLLAEREDNHNLIDIHAYLGEIYAAFGCYTKAEAELTTSLQLGFDLPAYHVRQGRFRRLAGRMEAAAAEFQQAIDHDPAHAGARIELGHELAAVGQGMAALQQFEMAARLEPDYADVHYQIGLIWLENGEFERSRVALERALEINPGFALARASMALGYVRAGDDARALEEFTQTMETGLRSADLMLNVALIHVRRGDTDMALAVLRRGTSISPGYAPLYYHLGRIYRDLGRKEEAREAWRRFFEFADELQFNDRLELFREDLRSPLLAAQG